MPGRNTTRRSRTITPLSSSTRTMPRPTPSRARAWMLKHYRDREIADYDAAIKLEPATRCTEWPEPKSWSARGMHDAAMADYAEALRLDPNNPAIWVSRGNEWRKDVKLDAQSPTSTRRSSLDPKYSPAYIARGNIWKQIGRFDLAIQEFSELIRIDPQEPRRPPDARPDPGHRTPRPGPQRQMGTRRSHPGLRADALDRPRRARYARRRLRRNRRLRVRGQVADPGDQARSPAISLGASEEGNQHGRRSRAASASKIASPSTRARNRFESEVIADARSRHESRPLDLRSLNRPSRSRNFPPASSDRRRPPAPWLCPWRPLRTQSTCWPGPAGATPARRPAGLSGNARAPCSAPGRAVQ